MVKLFSKNSNLCDHNSPTSQTDRQTTCDRNTALCTKVHRAVKTITIANKQYRKAFNRRHISVHQFCILSLPSHVKPSCQISYISVELMKRTSIAGVRKCGLLGWPQPCLVKGWVWPSTDPDAAITLSSVKFWQKLLLPKVITFQLKNQSPARQVSSKSSQTSRQTKYAIHTLSRITKIL